MVDAVIAVRDEVPHRDSLVGTLDLNEHCRMYSLKPS